MGVYSDFRFGLEFPRNSYKVQDLSVKKIQRTRAGFLVEWAYIYRPGCGSSGSRCSLRAGAAAMENMMVQAQLNEICLVKGGVLARKLP